MVGRLEDRGVVVIARDTTEMMAGVAASERGTQAGPREDDLVLPPAVSERCLAFVFFVPEHLALVLLRGHLVVCAHVSLFCSLNSALVVVRFSCLVSQSMGALKSVLLSCAC